MSTCESVDVLRSIHTVPRQTAQIELNIAMDKHSNAEL